MNNLDMSAWDLHNERRRLLDALRYMRKDQWSEKPIDLLEATELFVQYNKNILERMETYEKWVTEFAALNIRPVVFPK